MTDAKLIQDFFSLLENRSDEIELTGTKAVYAHRDGTLRVLIRGEPSRYFSIALTRINGHPILGGMFPHDPRALGTIQEE